MEGPHQQNFCGGDGGGGGLDSKVDHPSHKESAQNKKEGKKGKRRGAWVAVGEEELGFCWL